MSLRRLLRVETGFAKKRGARLPFGVGEDLFRLKRRGGQHSGMNMMSSGVTRSLRLSEVVMPFDIPALYI